MSYDSLDQAIVIGVVSFGGTDCQTKGSPVVYARDSKFLKFIKKNMGKLSGGDDKPTCPPPAPAPGNTGTGSGSGTGSGTDYDDINNW